MTPLTARLCVSRHVNFWTAPSLSESVRRPCALNCLHGLSGWGGFWKNPTDYQHFQISKHLADKLIHASPSAAAQMYEEHTILARNPKAPFPPPLSTRDLLNLLGAVADQGACFKSLRDTWADTTTPHGRLMLTVLGGCSLPLRMTFSAPIQRRLCLDDFRERVLWKQRKQSVNDVCDGIEGRLPRCRDAGSDTCL